MARAGAFKDVDSIFFLANNATATAETIRPAPQTLWAKFVGMTSPRRPTPEAGGSALDALMLINFSIEFMRLFYKNHSLTGGCNMSGDESKFSEAIGKSLVAPRDGASHLGS